MEQEKELECFCKTKRSEVGEEAFEEMRNYFRSFMDVLEAVSGDVNIRLQNEWCREKMEENKYSDPYVAPCNQSMISLWALSSIKYSVPFNPNGKVPVNNFSYAILVTDNDERIDVPNLLHHINDTADTIELSVRRLPYIKDEQRNPDAEGRLPTPFIPSFYRFVLREKRIPTQEEFFTEYYTDCLLAGFDYDRKPNEYKIGFKNRICSRTYPSVIRDIHFCKVLAEVLPAKGYDVLYNSELDIKGIDVLIRKRETGKLIGVCLFVDTKKSNEQIAGHKAYKRRYFRNVEFFEFPIPCNKTSKGIWLYDKSSVSILLEELKNK